jgi:hypothetical protein
MHFNSHKQKKIIPKVPLYKNYEGAKKMVEKHTWEGEKSQKKGT